MAFPNLSDLAATTIEYRSKDIADNVTQHNAALLAMKKSGGFSTFYWGVLTSTKICRLQKTATAVHTVATTRCRQQPLT